MQCCEIVVVATYNSYLEAEMAKSVLQSRGIYAEIRDGIMSTFYPVAIPLQLLVREDDAETARLLLEQH